MKVSYELYISVIHEAFVAAIHERSNNLSDNHIYNTQMSYKSGVIVCRSTVDGMPLGEKLSTLSMTELEKIHDKKQII